MSSATISFDDLMGLYRAQVGKPSGPGPGTLANMEGALKAFLTERGKSVNEPIGSTLRISYYSHTQEHTKTLVSHGRPSAYISNRRSLLKTWKDILNVFDTQDAGRRRAPPPWQQAIRRPVIRTQSP